MGCGERPLCGSRGGGPDCRPFARASAYLRERKELLLMCKCKSKKGFTLAELLVVVAIIAVLVAIAIPVFGASQKKAKLAVDHAAIRDAYAIVQIANNLEEVEIEGTTYTFEQMKDANFIYGPVFCLSKDCSSLLKFSGGNLSDYYQFQADGMPDDSTPCPECTIWDSTLVDVPISQLHNTDLISGLITVTFVASENKLVLGFSF